MTWLIQTAAGDVCLPCHEDDHIQCDGGGCECAECAMESSEEWQ